MDLVPHVNREAVGSNPARPVHIDFLDGLAVALSVAPVRDVPRSPAARGSRARRRHDRTRAHAHEG